MFRKLSVGFILSLTVITGWSNRSGDKGDLFLEVLPKNGTFVSQKPVELQLRIKQIRTRQTLKDFEVVHEKRLHLVILSEDLKWFRHLHPVQKKDGSWVTQINFPMGKLFSFCGCQV
jgi:hypothetical protein